MKKTLALLLVLALMATLFVVSAAAESTEKPFEGVTLTYWVRLHENATGVFDNYAKSKWYEAIHEATGITIEFIHPAAAAGDDKTEFNLMIAGGEYPDIIETNWTTYPGGPSAAIEDGVVMALDDAIASGKVPNLKAILDAEPSIDKSIKTSDGHYYVFPFLRGTSLENNPTLFSSGFFMRGDILKELNLEVPETIDEWYNVLTAVKAAHPEMIPVVSRTEWLNQIFCPGFDNYWDYYVDNGVVKYGIAEDSHYEYLQAMAKWYAEGLLDPDYLTHTKANDLRTIMASGQAFCLYDASSGGTSNIIPPLLESGAIKDESDIVTTVPVTSEKGKNTMFAKMNAPYDASAASVAISTQCKNVEAALWLMDWMYSEAGHMINCWGIEGESYVIGEDGTPTYTDVILNNPDGLSIAQAQSIYVRPSNGAVVSDPNVSKCLAVYTAQKDGPEKWTATDFGQYMYPAGAAVATEDADEFANITNNIKTYKEEMEAKWITGNAELTEESWAAYKAQLETYGLSRAIEIKQAAYDTFMAN